jgi:hypothetical protein
MISPLSGAKVVASRNYLRLASRQAIKDFEIAKKPIPFLLLENHMLVFISMRPYLLVKRIRQFSLDAVAETLYFGEQLFSHGE